MSLGAQVNFLSDLHSNRLEDFLNMDYFGDLSQVYIKLFSFHFQGFRNGTALAHHDSKSKVGEKLEILVWRVVFEYSWSFEILEGSGRGEKR